MNAIRPQIFPTGLPLIHGPDLTEHLAAWAAARIPHVGADGFGPCWAVGVVRGDALAAAVVFHDWQPQAGTVQLSCAAETPRWATRQVIGAVLGAAFAGRLGAPARKVWTAIPSSNARAIRFNRGIGLTQEAVLRQHFARGVHAVICSILDREWRKKYGEGAI
jgi:RimJ/RimL family protein N-acetyltransferase